MNDAYLNICRFIAKRTNERLRSIHEDVIDSIALNCDEFDALFSGHGRSSGTIQDFDPTSLSQLTLFAPLTSSRILNPWNGIRGKQEEAELVKEIVGQGIPCGTLQIVMQHLIFSTRAPLKLSESKR